MSAKQNRSKKTDRSAIQPKKGAVRQHTKKQGVAPRSEGDDVLTQARQDRGNQEIHGVVQLDHRLNGPFRVEFQQRLKEMADKMGWVDKEHNLLVIQYARSLMEGDGRPPADLCTMSVKTVKEFFEDFCTNRHIAYSIVDPEELAAAS